MSEHLVPYLKQVDEQSHGVVFQEDNAPCHVGKYATWWRQTHGIDCLPWPAQSPDLNPIEHLWDHLNRQVRKRTPLPTSLPKLEAALQEEWARIPVEVVRKLYRSVPSRRDAVIKPRACTLLISSTSDLVCASGRMRLQYSYPIFSSCLHCRLSAKRGVKFQHVLCRAVGWW